jgi:hypothetical protein
MLDCGGDEGDVGRIKQSGEETKPSLANVIWMWGIFGQRKGNDRALQRAAKALP